MALYFPAFKYLGAFPWTPVVTTTSTDVGPGTQYPVAVPLEDLWGLYWRCMRFNGEANINSSTSTYTVDGDGPIRATVTDEFGSIYNSPLELMFGAGYSMLISDFGALGATLEFVWGASSRIYNGQHYPALEVSVSVILPLSGSPTMKGSSRFDAGEPTIGECVIYNTLGQSVAAIPLANAGDVDAISATIQLNPTGWSA